MASVQGRVEYIGRMGTFTDGQPDGVFRILLRLASPVVAFIQLECNM